MTTVTREMIGAAHDVMLAKGDFVLSANLLERIYLAMEQAAPPPQTPFDTCPTCEALARAPSSSLLPRFPAGPRKRRPLSFPQPPERCLCPKS